MICPSCGWPTTLVGNTGLRRCLGERGRTGCGNVVASGGDVET